MIIQVFKLTNGKEVVGELEDKDSTILKNPLYLEGTNTISAPIAFKPFLKFIKGTNVHIYKEQLICWGDLQKQYFRDYLQAVEFHYKDVDNS